jgi:adenosine kinase
MAIFVSGSIAYDRIMDFPGKFADHILPEKIHVLNVCFNVNGMIEHFGGTAGNISYGLSLLGERPIVVAAVGKDFDPYRTWLTGNNLVLDQIRIIEEEFTASAYITTDQSDNQITGFNPGAMRHPTNLDLAAYQSRESIGIIAPGNLEDMKGYAGKFREHSIPYILDPGQSLNIWDAESLIDALTGSMIFISNDYELDLTMSLTGLTAAEMLERTQTIITTKGESGSVITTKTGGDVFIPPVKPERVSDPTGAGDAYRAGLIKGLVHGKSIGESGRLGATLASFAVEVHGTQEYRCSPEQFQNRYESAFGALE